jgi:hypothetical protein
MPRRAALLAICLPFALHYGCASAPPPPPTPEATVQAFARAINAGKLEEAYALMSADYRARVSLEQWKKRLTEQPQEALELSNALGAVREPADQRAYVTYDDGEQLELRRDGDRWYLATNVADFYDQSTPRAALRAFVRAMERKRYDVVMRLIPAQDKEGITTERMQQAWSGAERESVERMLSALREHLDDPIEVVGNRATMPYGEHARVQLVREGNAWKVEDPE